MYKPLRNAPPGMAKLLGLHLLQLLAGSGSQCAWGWLQERKSTHLLPGFSRSRSLRTDLPSTSGGGSSPAMSRIVGARSMFRTICGTLQRDRWLYPGPNTSAGRPVGLLSPCCASLAFSASPLPAVSSETAQSKINWLSQGSLERRP